MVDFLLAAEAGSEGAITPVMIGIAVFTLLMILLFITVTFGKGRDHT